MESIKLAVTFATNDPDICSVVVVDTFYKEIVNNYTGDNTIEDFERYLETEVVPYIVEWERPRNWPKGRI